MAFGVGGVVRVACLSRGWFVLYGVNKPTARRTGPANDFVGAGGRAREKLLLAGYLTAKINQNQSSTTISPFFKS